jgi:hypothetical protein
VRCSKRQVDEHHEIKGEAAIATWVQHRISFAKGLHQSNASWDGCVGLEPLAVDFALALVLAVAAHPVFGWFDARYPVG